MTVPGGDGIPRPDMLSLPLRAPFDDAASAPESSCSTSQQTQSRTARSNWTLWPLKMSSTSLTHRSSDQQVQSSHGPAQSPPPCIQIDTAYPAASSISSSPPSPLGPGNLSDSSPPSTPPDYASSTLFTSKHVSTPSKKADQQQLTLQTPPITVSSPSSRNNIFSSPVISPVPAPRLQTTGLEGLGTTRRSPSRNVGFFESPTSGSTSSPQSSTSARVLNEYARSVDDSERPSYGRANTEERAKEMDRVRRNNAEVDFRLCPVKDYLLGEGRHCTVYLGSFRSKHAVGKTAGDGSDHRHWTLCAIKRLHADRQSQLLGLEEAFALRRLGPHPNIVGLISIRDEVELVVTSPTDHLEASSWSGVAIPLSLSREQQEEMQTISPSSSIGLTSHWRSSSDSQAEPVIASEKSIHRMQTHRRQISTPTSGPVVKVASPEGDEVFSSTMQLQAFSWEDTSNSSLVDSSSADPPRLLMLLELLPYSLSSFAKKNPDKVDLAQWKQWALQLTGVVEWLHCKGCVHADLKPENVLLTSDLTVKLCDFNSALFPTPNTPLTDGLGLGTPAYGAPELASRNSKGFSYPVDIWSLGAILYTLAVGTEPFRKARSMIDILHRKGRFFESEENDRIAALSVAEGRAASLNGGSTNASRNGSLRGKKKGESDVASTSTTRPSGMLQREYSSESISSIASSVMLSGSSGRNPSVRAVSMLLEPSPPLGVVIPPNPSLKHFRFGRGIVGSNSSNALSPPSMQSHGHHRATSLGKESKSLLSPGAGASRRANQVFRPSAFRRTTSYGGGEPSDSPQQDTSSSAAETGSKDQITPSHSDSTGLRLAVTAAFAQSSRDEGGEVKNEEDVQLHRPYKDGSPALLLPGGGRLPDEARNLLEKMLSTNASRRPTAAQVRQLLEALP